MKVSSLFCLFVAGISSAFAATTDLSPGDDIVDTHATKVSMKEIVPSEDASTFERATSHILFTIDRLDELKNNQTHAMLAARFQHIVVSLTLHPNGSLFLNNHSLPIGHTEFDMKVKTLTAVMAHNKTEAADIKNHFDEGVLVVRVSTAGRDLMVENVLVRRVVVMLKFMEMNSKSLEVHQFIEKILEIRPVGVFSSRPCMSRFKNADEALEYASKHHVQFPNRHALLSGGVPVHNSDWQRFVAWFKQLPHWVKTVACLVVSGVVSGLLLLTLGLLMNAVRYMMGYRSIKNKQTQVFAADEKSAFLAQVYMGGDDEKSAQVLFAISEPLPSYNGYTAVNTTEKQ